jgi:hypothetical protein
MLREEGEIPSVVAAEPPWHELLDAMGEIRSS